MAAATLPLQCPSLRVNAMVRKYLASWLLSRSSGLPRVLGSLPHGLRSIVPGSVVLCSILVCSILLGMTTLYAEFSVHPLFTDHAVVQQKQPILVWGAATPGQSVQVDFAEQSSSATADQSGRWMVALEPLSASKVGRPMIVRAGDSELVIEDLLVGEVWVCSGQSNMAAAIRNSTDYSIIENEIAGGDRFETLRLFKVPIEGADARRESVEAGWAKVNAATAAVFSATGFYFGRALNRDRDVPVGLIQSCNGGTNAYSWINSDTYQNDPVAEVARDAWAAVVAKGPANLQRFQKQKSDWTIKVRNARQAKKTIQGRAPREPLHQNHVKRPSGHYNAMIAPLQPYAIAGAIWYQGEANSRPPFCTQYRDLMFGLVDDWRSDWHDAAGGLAGESRRDFPFYLVQLPNYANGHPQGWPIIREQMLRFWLDGEQTGMVTTIDVGDPKDIHPRNKKPVGERLALFARANAYGESVVHSGPIFKSLQTDGGQAVITFDHAGGGLVSLDGEPLRHFTAAGDDGTFYPAEARIQDDRLIVTSPRVGEVKKVRYAWTNNPENPNFGNREKLIASPFRTDTASIILD